MTIGLYFGWRSAVLLCALLVTLPIAFALWRSFDNRAANRVMAALLLVLSGVVTPWLIGFAGFYDRWPWLTFLPVAQPLLVPPLLLAFVESTTGGRTLRQLWRWFLPGLIMTLFKIGSFLLPLRQKLAWADASSRTAGLIEYGLLVLLFVAILIRAHAQVSFYRAALADQRSDAARFGLGWLMSLMTAMAILWSLWAGYAIAATVGPLTYDGFLPLYLAIAATSVWLAIEAWRHGQLPWPRPATILAGAEEPERPARDWHMEGERWAAILQQAEAYRDSSLTLRRAARVAGTNEAYLSRACNEGLGLSFSALIQRFRSEAVAAALDTGSAEDLLTIAHDAGFASKASFNRAFAARFGMSPSAYRRRLKMTKTSSLSAE